MRLYILAMGAIDLADGAYFLPRSRHSGQRVTLPLPAYLIQDNAGEYFLVDTGMPAAYAGPSESAIERSPFGAGMIPLLDKENIIQGQLALLGLQPADIGTVICTHLDWDHCGGHVLFPHARFLIQREQLEAAYSDRERYRPEDWDHPGLCYEAVDGSYEITAGLQLIHTPGHCVGHQSVLLSLPQFGRVALCADAILTHEHLDGARWDLYPDSVGAQASAIALLSYVQDNGLLVFGHDPEQWRTLRHAPAFYE